MTLAPGIPDRRRLRHQATKAEIVEAAWEVAREKGLAGLSLGDVAARVGMRAPSLYSYFVSKHDIYDAMFAQGNEEFLLFIRARLAELPRSPRERIRGGFRITFDFCVAEPVRYQLLFQRTIPGFVPSEASYAKAVEVLRLFHEDLKRSGLLREPSDEDLLTALGIGLIDQQITNDPGGDRWGQLVDEVADMAYEHLMKKRRKRSPTTTRRSS